MKLAEALAERATTQTRLTELRSRLGQVIRVQEDEPAGENPAELLAEVEAAHNRLEFLIRAINRTNSSTQFNDQLTITDAIAARDVAGMRHKLYTHLADLAAGSETRYSRSEVRYVSTVDVAELRAKADDAAKTYRQIDVELQRLNWQVDLAQ